MQLTALMSESSANSSLVIPNAWIIGLSALGAALTAVLSFPRLAKLCGWIMLLAATAAPANAPRLSLAILQAVCAVGTARAFGDLLLGSERVAACRAQLSDRVSTLLSGGNGR